MKQPLSIKGKFNFDELATEFEIFHKIAMRQIAVQALNWCVNGSPALALKPPVFTGNLRGSASVFVGNDFVKDSAAMRENLSGQRLKKGERAHPNRELENKINDIITIGFNAQYALRMHEERWNPGKFSSIDGNTGNKYLEKHLQADGKYFTEMYANLLKRYNRSVKNK
jgi:hypothetical protein